jgi:hypothetical protein
MKRTACACLDRHMHDQNIRSLRERCEARVGSGLIGAENDGGIARLYAVRQGWETAVWPECYWDNHQGIHHVCPVDAATMSGTMQHIQAAIAGSIFWARSFSCRTRSAFELSANSAMLAVGIVPGSERTGSCGLNAGRVELPEWCPVSVCR